MSPIYPTIALLGLTSTSSGIFTGEEPPFTIYSPSSQTILAETKLTSCGKDWDCFINLAKTCTPAQVKRDTFLDIWGLGIDYTDPNLLGTGISFTETSLSEIWGQKGDKCLFFYRIESYQFHLSDELKNTLISEGMTPEEIAEYDRELAGQYSQYQMICRFNQGNDLATYLKFITRHGNYQTLNLGISASADSPISGDFVHWHLVLTSEGRNIGECDGQSPTPFNKL